MTDELEKAKLQAQIRKEEALERKYKAEAEKLERDLQSNSDDNASDEKTEAELQKELALQRKYNLEADQLEENISKPFYSDVTFLRPVIAGLSLALILAGYLHYVFYPTVSNLNHKADAAEIKLQHNVSRHEAIIAKLDLVKTRIEEEALRSQNRLKEANARLEKALKQSDDLLAQIDKLKEKKIDCKSADFSEIEEKAKQNKSQITSQLAEIADQKIIVEELGEETRAKEANLFAESGWMYIGYFPDGEWNFINIRKDNGEKVEGMIVGEDKSDDIKIYEVTGSVNVRDNFPVFSWVSYKFGKKVGLVVPGQKVRILETEKVGRSKIWAKVKVVEAGE